MRRTRNNPTSSRAGTTVGRGRSGDPQRPLELSPDHAFVLHLDIRARPPRQMLGRVEHVTSGQVAHVTSLGSLVAFMAQVLRAQARREPPGRAYATVIQQPYDGDADSTGPDSGDGEPVPPAPRPARRRRKKGADS